MARGGARLGAGRKRSTPVVEAKKREPKAFAPDGKKSADAPPEWPFGTVPEVDPPAIDPNAEPLTPLDYLLGIVRDEGADKRLRMQAAALAAPFMHARVAPMGKKEQRQEAAKTPSRFKATTAPPRLVHSA